MDRKVYSDKDIEELCFPDTNEYERLKEKGWEYFFGAESSGKMAVLEKLLEHFYRQRDKVLLFSCSVKVKASEKEFVLFSFASKKGPKLFCFGKNSIVSVAQFDGEIRASQEVQISKIRWVHKGRRTSRKGHRVQFDPLNFYFPHFYQVS